GAPVLPACFLSLVLGEAVDPGDGCVPVLLPQGGAYPPFPCLLVHEVRLDGGEPLQAFTSVLAGKGERQAAFHRCPLGRGEGIAVLDAVPGGGRRERILACHAPDAVGDNRPCPGMIGCKRRILQRLFW